MAGRSLHLFFVTLGLLCLWFPHAQGQTCAPGQLRNGSFSVALPYLVAQNMGYFAAEGISPCLSTVTGSEAQFNDFKAGKYDLVQTASDNVINRYVNEKLPLQIFLSVSQDEGIRLVGNKNNGINSLQDLNGKPILVDAVDSGYAFNAQYILSTEGLFLNKTPGYTFVPVGGSIRNTYVFQGKTPTGATAYATMVTGAVSYDVPFTSNGTSQVLADFKKLWAPRLYATTCYAGDKTWLANNQQTILGFTRAWIRAGNFITNPANRPAVVQLIATNNQIRPEAAAAFFDDSLSLASQNFLGQPVRSAYQGTIDVRAQFNGFSTPVINVASLANGDLVNETYWQLANAQVQGAASGGSPCRNGGVSTTVSGQPGCACPAAYIGPTCEVPRLTSNPYTTF